MSYPSFNSLSELFYPLAEMSTESLRHQLVLDNKLSDRNQNELFITLVLETTFSQVLLGQVCLQVAQSCMWSE